MQALSNRSKSPSRNEYVRIISRDSSMTSDGLHAGESGIKENEIELEIS